MLKTICIVNTTKHHFSAAGRFAFDVGYAHPPARQQGGLEASQTGRETRHRIGGYLGTFERGKLNITRLESHSSRGTRQRSRSEYTSKGGHGATAEMQIHLYCKLQVRA